MRVLLALIAFAALANHPLTAQPQPPAPETYDVVILGGHVMDPASNLDGVRNIGIRAGKIAILTAAGISGK